MNKHMTITAIIHTKNSAETLSRALQSVAWTDETLVVDMGSTDDTLKIAKSFGTTILPVKDFGYVEPARNLALKQVKTDWILILDSDEEIPSSLATKLKALAGGDATAEAYNLPRKNIVFGDWLAVAGWWPDYQLRFFRRGTVNWPATIHSTPKVDGSVDFLSPQEEFAITHYNYPTVSSYLERLDRYTTHEVSSRDSTSREAQSANSKHSFSTESLLKAWSNELFHRFFQQGGQNGHLRGAGIAMLQSMYELVVVLKQWEAAGFPEAKSSSATTSQVSERFWRDFQKDLNYWLADWHVERSAGLAKVVWQLRRKFKV